MQLVTTPQTNAYLSCVICWIIENSIEKFKRYQPWLIIYNTRVLFSFQTQRQQVEYIVDFVNTSWHCLEALLWDCYDSQKLFFYVRISSIF